MTVWLKKSLIVWFGGAVALGAATYSVQVVRAQSSEIDAAHTPQQAAKMFALLLSRESEWNLQRTTVSAKDFQALNDRGVSALLETLREDSKAPQFEIAKTQNQGQSVVVEVAPAKNPLALPVVCVRELDPNRQPRWKVDLIATFAKRRALGEGQYQTAILEITNVALPGLPDAETPYVRKKVCQGNLKTLGLALSQYVQDYDEIMPPAINWTEVLTPYTPSSAVFNCPSAPGGKYGYAYNADFSMKSLAEITPQSQRVTPTFYETTVLAPNVSGRGENSAFRHTLFGANQTPTGQPSALHVTSSSRVYDRIPSSPRDFSVKLQPLKTGP